MRIGSAKIYNKFDAMTKFLEIFEKCGLQCPRHKKKRSLKLRLDVGEGGLEPPNGFPDRFTVCCNCHYATPPRMKELLSLIDSAKVHLFSFAKAKTANFFATLRHI